MMVKCVDCGKKQGMFDAWYNERCQTCHLTWQLENDHQFAAQQQQLIDEANAKQTLQDEIDAIMLTTETAPNLNMTKQMMPKMPLTQRMLNKVSRCLDCRLNSDKIFGTLNLAYSVH